MFGRWFGPKRPPSASHPWLEPISGTLSAFGHKAEETAEGLRFLTGPVPVEIRYRPHSYATPDGLQVSGIFEIDADLSVVPGEFASSAEAIGILNKEAAIGALIPNKASTKLHGSSRVSLYVGDEAAAQMHVPLLAISAMTTPRVFTHALAGAMGMGEGLPQDALWQGGPSQWTESDFEPAVAALEAQQVLAFSSPTGLTAEVPWDAGAVSAALSGRTWSRTSLLQISNEALHPSLGAGLLIRLQLPHRYDPGVAAQIAQRLNRHEVEAIDSTPFFGAWCTGPTPDDVSYVTFLPNLLYMPGFLTTVAIWTVHRAVAASALLGPDGQ